MQHQQLLWPLNHPENPPTVVHLANPELPIGISPFGELDGRHPGVLGELEVVKKQTVAHIHAVKDIPVPFGYLELFG